MDVRVRPARSDDVKMIEQIEIAADALLVDRFDAVDWPPPTPGRDRVSAAGFILVAERPGARTTAATIVGFVHVIELDGHAHLEQLSVLPAFGRRGIGRQLVGAALDEASHRGHREITLRSYVDVPWNAPFYATCGFVVSEPDTELLHALLQTETALGLQRFGSRVQMSAAL